MLLKSAYLRGFIITFVVGIGFFVMAVMFLDTQTSDLVKQLLAVFGLIVILMASAALIAWLVRKIFNRKSKG